MSDSAVFHDGRVVLLKGDCLALTATLADNSVDSVVTDAPYHLTSIVKRFGSETAAPAQHYSDGAFARASRGFMGKTWDGGDVAFRAETWREFWRVLKPGGHLVAFSGDRTYARMAVAIEDAGFEIRHSLLDLVSADRMAANFLASLNMAQLEAFARLIDESTFGGMLAWIYGSGFPKSHDMAKAIDKAAGVFGGTIATGDAVKRMIPGADQHRDGWIKDSGRDYQPGLYVPVTEDAQRWQGWGTALKPAFEPICLARKPLSEDTVAANVLKWGTGALHIDAARIGTDETIRATRNVALGSAASGVFGAADKPGVYRQADGGRWPANVLHDGSEEAIAGFPADAGGSGAASGPSLRGTNVSVARGRFNGQAADRQPAFHNDSGSASRFFYSAKADSEDRLGSKHPTIKPVGLMRWLVRLVTPPGGTVLDPFAGTGTTGAAAFHEGFNAILIEREAEYQEDIIRRMDLLRAGALERRAATVKVEPIEALPLFGSAAE